MSQSYVDMYLLYGQHFAFPRLIFRIMHQQRRFLSFLSRKNAFNDLSTMSTNSIVTLEVHYMYVACYLI